MTTQLTEVSAAVKGSKKKFHFRVAGDPTETVCLLRFCFASDIKKRSPSPFVHQLCSSFN